MSIGLIGTKLGMTREFMETGQSVPVTVIKIEKGRVLDIITNEKRGYNAVKIGFFKIKNSKVKKQMKGYFVKKNTEPKKILKEFRVENNGQYKEGNEIGLEIFKDKKFLDVKAKTIGKGFAGVMKRWNFGGLRASHGVSVSHRSHGSTGQRQDPGKVFKGKKMAGHMGDKQRTILNLEVVKSDLENNLLYLKGSIPGSKNSTVLLRESIKNVTRKTIKEKYEAKVKAAAAKKELRESNLFNAKLLYVNKLMQSYDLNAKQQRAIVEALDNMSLLIFKGNSIHRVRSNSEGNEISISLISQIQSEQAPIPRITRILKSDTVDYKQSTSILASVVIKEDSSQAPEMNWQFWEYSDDPSKPCKDDDPDNKVCGSFSPSEGSNNSWGVIVSDSEDPKTWYYDVFSDYTPSGDNNSITQHKLVFEAKNRQRIGVRQRFFISVTGPVPVSNTTNTSPSLDEFSAQRIRTCRSWR